MPANRFFYDGPLTRGPLSLKDDEHHHLKVMRTGIGESIEVVNGKGTLAIAKLTAMEKRAAIIEIVQVKTGERPSPRIALGLPLMRPSKLELIVEKGTELGADAFYFYPAEHSEKSQLSANQAERLRHLMIAALKQSGRLYLPSLECRASLDELLQHENILFGDTNSEAPWISGADRDVLLITGPEQGFSQQEIALLNKRAKGVKINSNILRAETAPIAALSILVTCRS